MDDIICKLSRQNVILTCFYFFPPQLVIVLKKEVIKTNNVSEHEDTDKYRQLLVRTLHSCSVRFPDMAANVIPVVCNSYYFTCNILDVFVFLLLKLQPSEIIKVFLYIFDLYVYSYADQSKNSDFFLLILIKNFAAHKTIDTSVYVLVSVSAYVLFCILKITNFHSLFINLFLTLYNFLSGNYITVCPISLLLLVNGISQ